MDVVAGGRFFAKLPRTLSRELGLGQQGRVPGAAHATAEEACRARARYIWQRRQEQQEQQQAPVGAATVDAHQQMGQPEGQPPSSRRAAPPVRRRKRAAPPAAEDAVGLSERPRFVRHCNPMSQPARPRRSASVVSAATATTTVPPAVAAGHGNMGSVEGADDQGDDGFLAQHRMQPTRTCTGLVTMQVRFQSHPTYQA